MADWEQFVRQRLGDRPEATELAQQLEQAYDAARAAGASEAEARHRAEAQLGDGRHLARALAAAQAPIAGRIRLPGGRVLADLLRDLRHSLRLWQRHRGFTLVAVLTLGLGIGACTAIFTLVDAVLLRPLPFPQPQRLVAGLETSRQFPEMSLSWPDYLDWRAENHVFTQLAAMRGSDMILAHLGPASFVLGQRVTANYFSMLGVAPALGRTFLPTEDRAGAPDVVVVSARFFRERLGSDPHWLGRTLELDGRARTLVGVMPAGFPGLMAAAREPEFWTPLGAYAVQDPSLMRRGNHAGILALGRLRPGVSLAQARADLTTIARGLAQQYPKTNAGNTALVQPYLDLIVGDASSALWMLLAAVGLLLLIACGNVANLLLARAAARQREQAVRAALGATRGRRVRQQMAESLALGGFGCGVGLLLAEAILRAAPALGPSVLPRAGTLALDPRVLGFALALALVTSLLCGLAPAFQFREAGIAISLKEGSHTGHTLWGGHRLRSLLAASEMALALLLLAGAGLLVRSLIRLQHQDPGFRPAGVLTFIIGLPDADYPHVAQQLEFFQQATERLQHLPGAAAVGGIYPLPLGGGDWEEPFLIVGAPRPEAGHEPSTDVAETRGDYFGAMGMRLLRGREFDPGDTASTPPVAVVDDTFAERYFPGPLPAALGRQITLDGVVRSIVGIVAHVQNRTLGAAAQPQVYLPQTQSTVNTAALYFVLRAARGDPEALRNPALGEIQAIDAGLPVTDVQTMEQRIALSLAQRRRMLGLIGAFAVLALLLAAGGIYGVISYAVAERTHEIGVRMALGASRGRVLALVLGQGLRLAAVGAAAGLALALAWGRLLGAFLYGIAPGDPATLAAVAALALAVAALACYLPARRATRVDPLVALRTE